jgi:selenophosphate synthetase-related protein
VVANVNDLAAMGGRPLGLVDTIVGSEALAREILRGIRQTAERYHVPVVGGHLTISDEVSALSAFVVGSARSLLAARNAAPGQELLVAAALDGHMHADFPTSPPWTPCRGSRLGSGAPARVAKRAGASQPRT